MPVVALSAFCVRRADVRPMVGPPSAVMCPVSNATSAIRRSGRTRVRCPRRLPPRCRSSAQLGPGAKADGPTSLQERRRQAWPPRRPSEAAAPHSPPGRPTELVRREGARPVGWEARPEARTDKSSRMGVLGMLPGGRPTTGLNREVVTTLRGRRGGGGAALPSGAGSLRVGGGRVRPQRGRGARRVLSTENGQRSDQRELWWARQGLNL